MSTPRDQLGLQGEQLAERFLRSRGCRVIARRFRTAAGELDLVVREGATLVFVEVKTQSDRTLLDPCERVTRGKQRRLGRAARSFVARHRCENLPCRFDVVSVVIDDSGATSIEHHPDAFSPPAWS
ncbi:MAG: YraN family protein [Phycisphaerae bacterium]|nr:YraN family protein [Phycisphaerae bacterium]